MYSQLRFLAENNSESLRKELTDVRRQLADSNFEKEKYHNTNKELRDHIKRTESEKREIGRQLEEAFQKITSKFCFLTPHTYCKPFIFSSG